MNEVCRRKLILYYEGEETGGVTGVIENIICKISSHHRVKLVCRKTSSLRAWSEKLVAQNVEIEPIALHNKADLFGWIDFKRLGRLVPLFRSADIIHFHLHTAFSCLPAIFLAKIVHAKALITTEHYITQLQYMRRRMLRFPLSIAREVKIRSLKVLKRLSLKYVDRIMTVSDSNRRFLLATFGSSLEGKVESVPNGIEVEKYISTGDQKSSLLNDLQLGVNPSHIITVVAGLNNQKGHEYLIRAVPQIIKQVPRALFLFVGDGHLRKRLQDLAQELGLAEHIVFTGARRDVPRILSASDLFVLPSLFEGMPLSLLEAMAAGKAIVATNVGGTVDVVVPNVTGFLVPPKDINALAEKIIQLLLDQELRNEFGRRGQERVRKYFDRKQMAQKYMEVYERIAQ